MAKSLSSILSQIERLQKEASAIQSEVIGRIQKEISKYGLTAEQLFGSASPRRVAKVSKAKGSTAKRSTARAAKYADETGNVWGGMGKRPEWLRQALAAGKAIEEFLVAKPAASTAKKRVTRKRAKAAEASVAAKPKTAAKKRAVAKKAPARKVRAKKATTAAEAT